MAEPSQEQAFSETQPVARDQKLDRGEALAAEVAGECAEAPARDDNRPLLAAEQRTRLDNEWQAVQAGFVDSPRVSVEKADALVKETIDAIASSFGGMRDSLERTWEKDREVSTEDLRVALQSYRSFFRRLLSI